MSTLPAPRFLDNKTPPHIFTLIMLTGLAALVMNIYLPSLPGMTEYFKTEYRLMQLSVALYLGANVPLQIFIGPISDMLGRRPMMLAGMVVFILATLGCILATNVWVFLVFRMIQATVVVAMVLSRAVVRDMVPDAKAASMIGYVTMGMAVVPMIGPAIGGFLDEAFGWKASFYALIVLGIAVTLLAYLDLGETAPRSKHGLRRQFGEYPTLLASPRFWGYSFSAALCSGAFFSYLGGAPFVGEQIFGMTPAELGVYFGSPAIGYFVGNYISGRASVRIGINSMVFYGTVINAAGIGINLALFNMGMGSALAFFGLMTFVGIGNGMVIPNATAGALSVRPNLAGSAAGLIGALMIGGGASLSAYAGILLNPETGVQMLLTLMLTTGLLAIATILLVILRERQIKS